MKTFSDEQLQIAVDKCCTCVGYAKGERLACPACNVWHELKPELTFSAPTVAPEPAKDLVPPGFLEAPKAGHKWIMPIGANPFAFENWYQVPVAPEPAKPEASGDYADYMENRARELAAQVVSVRTKLEAAYSDVETWKGSFIDMQARAEAAEKRIAYLEKCEAVLLSVEKRAREAEVHGAAADLRIDSLEAELAEANKWKIVCLI